MSAQVPVPTRTQEAVFFLIALAYVGLAAGATALFGLPGLAMVALCAVPIVWVTLLAITVGR